MQWVRERFMQFGQKWISVTKDESTTYAGFVAKIDDWRGALSSWRIGAGDRVGLIADYHIDVIALLVALLDAGCIVIPLAREDKSVFTERLHTACATKVITVAPHPPIDAAATRCEDVANGQKQAHPLLQPMVREGKAGFIIFTSGSTGKGKAVLLSYERMLKRLRREPGKAFRTLLFLKLDHIGGLNTLLSVILNGGTIVTAPTRQVKDICRCIERFAVELLPTTPSFLTLLLMSAHYRDYDLSSLKIISYGTEVMPGSTLSGLHRLFPQVLLKQTYGLSELGILPTKSKNSESKWMKIGGDGFDVQVRDGVLWIKSEQAMLGYLNAASPFDDKGWYNTGDRVEVDGEYFRILGRECELINVAGEKVFPIEIENFMLTLDNVNDVVVRGKKSPVTGQIIWAECAINQPEDENTFKKRILEACRNHLPPFKIPGLVTIAQYDTIIGSRFKKNRMAKNDPLQ